MYAIGTTSLDKCYLFCVITGRHSDSNGTRSHNHLVRKRTPNHLAKLVYPEVLLNRHIIAFFETSDLKVRILFFIARITVQC